MDSVKHSKKLLVYNAITSARWLQVFAPVLQSGYESNEHRPAEKAQEHQCLLFLFGFWRNFVYFSRVVSE
jgi:hypothetical protein